MRKFALAVLFCGFVLGIVPAAGSAPRAALFSENFESGLSRWIGAGGNPHHGVIVDDPIRAGNHVLSFTGLRSGGDILSAEIPVSANTTYRLKFDYLGTAGNGGGIIGVALGTPGDHRWLAGTQTHGAGESNPLVVDGHWHTYTIDFKPGGRTWNSPDGTKQVTPASITALRIMIEANWGIAGDAYFDNISLEACNACLSEEPFKVQVSWHAQSLVTSPPRDGGRCPATVRAKVTGHFEAQITPAGDHQGGGTVVDTPHLAKCRVPVINFQVDHLGLAVLNPGKTLQAVLQVHISGEGVHQPGQCVVGTKGTITATFDSTSTASNSLQNDSLKIGPWQSPCNAHNHLITNNISKITADAHGSTWVRVFIGCPAPGYSPRNCVTRR